MNGVSRKTPNISAKWKSYHEFFSLLELKKLLATFCFFKQLIEIAEIRRLVQLLLSPQILTVKSSKKKKKLFIFQINTYVGKPAGKQTITTDVTKHAGERGKMGIKLN